MIDRLFSRFSLGFGLGYVLGAKAGRERYEQMQGWWSALTGTPALQKAADQGRQWVSETTGNLASKVQRSPQDIREVMTAAPETVGVGSTLSEAATQMKRQDAGAMVVVDETEKVVGIITDRDIAVRAVAEGRDVKTTRVGEVTSRDLETLAPTDSVDDAVRIMRERKIRRLPVVEGGRPVGIVSLGDLALERDQDSVLASVSQPPPNN
jgi:CBS domain-containing protein